MEKPVLNRTILVRLPAEVAERIRDAAIQNTRSVAQETRYALTKIYSLEPKQ